MTLQPAVNRRVLVSAVVRALSFIVIMPLLFRLISGRWDYWQGWIYLTILFVPMIIVVAYYLRHNPAFLERRMKYTEKLGEQQWIVVVAGGLMLLAIFLPGLDIRFGWSHVPVWLVIAADLLVLLGLAVFIWVMRTNAFLSRVVEVTPEQRVISSGPYALVRHPMYTGVTLMFVFTSMALGSFWFIIPGLLTIPVLAARILSEERLLASDLPGYRDYMNKTHYRLIPGIW